MNWVDLNCDLGEGFGAYTIGCDAEIIPLVTSVNIGCGFHGGDPVTMAVAVAMAAEAGVGIGAHPGLPDLLGFGRREMAVSPAEAAAYVTYQVGALAAFCTARGARLSHVKPHGALYNMAARDEALARAIAEAVARVDGDLILLGLSGSALPMAAARAGLRAVSEVFADRAYLADGSLAPRGMPGAVLHDAEAAAARVVRMLTERRVETLDGGEIAVELQSVCVHGDGAEALAFVRGLRGSLQQAGAALLPLAEGLARDGQNTAVSHG
ncbi:LamB/YcsF family protein [Ruminococcaceae bacterium OttesenSCG-928-A11]|nr:LamB/YcsF family protein [Ruminococcaceae bacterium OttesenSCG-928-A11]